MDSISELDRHVIGSQADVYRMWEVLMGPLGFSTRHAWVVMVDHDGRPLRQITKIDEMPDDPAGFSTDGFFAVFADLLDETAPGGSIAVLLCRPGTSRLGPDDRAIARAFLDGARRAAVSLQPLHLATDEQIVVVAPDDLAA